MPPKLNPRDRETLSALPFDSWKDTLATLHMWTQIVGKVRLELCPLVNHWWNVHVLRDRSRPDDFHHAVRRRRSLKSASTSSTTSS